MKQSEAGFTLVELLVAMTLLAIVLLGVAQMNFRLAQRFRTLSGAATRDGIMAQEASYFTTIDFDSLPSKAGTTVVSAGPLPHTRVITVDNQGPKLRRVTIVITPDNTLLRPDSVVIERAKAGGNPFNKKP